MYQTLHLAFAAALQIALDRAKEDATDCRITLSQGDGSTLTLHSKYSSILVCIGGAAQDCTEQFYTIDSIDYRAIADFDFDAE